MSTAKPRASWRIGAFLTRKEEIMLNGGMLLMLLLLLIYTFGGSGSLTTENLTLIVLALGFLVGSNQENAGCGCGASN